MTGPRLTGPEELIQESPGDGMADVQQPQPPSFVRGIITNIEVSPPSVSTGISFPVVR